MTDHDFASSRLTYARALLELATYARTHQDDFSLGPLDVASLEHQGLTVTGSRSDGGPGDAGEGPRTGSGGVMPTVKDSEDYLRQLKKDGYEVIRARQGRALAYPLGGAAGDGAVREPGRRPGPGEPEGPCPQVRAGASVLPMTGPSGLSGCASLSVVRLSEYRRRVFNTGTRLCMQEAGYLDTEADDIRRFDDMTGRIPILTCDYNAPRPGKDHGNPSRRR